MIKSNNQYQSSNVTHLQLHGMKAGSQHQHCRSQMTNKWNYKCSQSQVNTSGYLSVNSRWTKVKQNLQQPRSLVSIQLYYLPESSSGRCRPAIVGAADQVGKRVFWFHLPGQKIDWQWGEIGSDVFRIHCLFTAFFHNMPENSSGSFRAANPGWF